MEVISGKPYTDIDDIRLFNVADKENEYVWHRDMADRHIEILEGEAWQLQYNGCLPILLEENNIELIVFGFNVFTLLFLFKNVKKLQIFIK